MKRRFVAVMAAIILILIAGGLYFLQQPKEKAVVRVGYLPIMTCLPAFVGEEQGYFTKQGITVKLVRYESSQQMMDGLLQGRVDVITSVSTAVALIVQEKSPNQFKAFGISTTGKENPVDAILVKANSNITTVQDLKGKKIGSFPGVQVLTLLKKYLRESGLDPDRDVQIQEMKQDLHLQALDSGQVDAVLTLEPNATIGKQKGISKTLVKAPQALASVDPVQLGIYVISKSYLEANHQAAEKFILAFGQSMNYINDNHDEARRVLTTFTPIKQSVASEVPLAHFETVEMMDKKSYQQFANVFYDEKVLTKRSDINSFLLQ